MFLNSLQCLAQPSKIQDFLKLSEIYPEQTLKQIEQQLLLTTLPNNQRAMLHSIKADAAYYVDQPDLILDAAQKALSSGLLNRRWQVKTLITKARGHYQMKEYKQFFQAANEAVLKSEQYNLTVLKAAAVIERANANALFKKHTKSEEDLALANRYLKALPDTFTKGVMQERYTGALRLLGRFEEAVISQHKSIEVFKKTQSIHFLAVSYYNLGRVYDAAGDIEKATENMELSYRWALEDRNKLNQAFSLSRLAEYQLKLNQTAEAEKTLIKALKIADQSPSFKVQFLARKDLALLTCTKTSNLACQNSLNAAIVFAGKYNMLADKSELLQRLAAAYFQVEQYQLAYQTLKQSLTLVREN